VVLGMDRGGRKWVVIIYHRPNPIIEIVEKIRKTIVLKELSIITL